MGTENNRPSKQFLIRGSIAIGIVAVLLVVQTTWFRSLFNKGAGVPVVATNDTTVGDILGKDSNGNGIADWEEKLWGLDPAVLYTNGMPNRQIIEDKKKALGISDSASAPKNETDRLSRELFTLATALGQSDTVDSETLQQIAADFGSSIDTDLISNRYSSKDIQTIQTTAQALTVYANQVKAVLSKYTQVDNDTAIIFEAVQTGDESGLATLSETKRQYDKLTKELVAIKTPIGVAGYHLGIVNGIAGVADSFEIIQELNDNGISALVGIALYKNYNSVLDNSTAELTDYLTQYGILQQ